MSAIGNTNGNAVAATLDGLLPHEIAAKAEDVGVKKGALGFTQMFLLAVLAGGFIALGAVFSTVLVAGAEDKLPFGIIRLLAGLGFCLGLILVVIGGAELFTGNSLQVMALASGKLRLQKLLRGWIVVYFGNFAGCLLTVWLMYLAQEHMLGAGVIGLSALKTAEAKCDLAFMTALTRGLFCNALVCLAVWMSLSCRSTGDKILCIIFPITAFVAAGFEHCIANMYFIPIGLFIKAGAPAEFWSQIGQTAAAFPHITWSAFLVDNLIPVTLGNILGGGVMVGIVYWIVYIRGRQTQES
ncbi:MAG: formate transporter FocA [Candidatus Sumerlaeota bacterium]|nr:formate transporter FocA [Candidatus Sumerlaeota bacterium]